MSGATLERSRLRSVQMTRGSTLPLVAGAVVFDLDGTLIGPEERISSAVERAVRAAARSVPVAIASGREPDDVAHFARRLGLTGPQVSDNGARILYPMAGRTIWQRAMPSANARRIIGELQRRWLRFFAMDGDRFVTSADLIAEWRITVVAAHTLTEAASSELISALTPLERASAVPSCDAAGTKWYVNFTHASASKGAALRRYARMVGVACKEIVAVSDSFNDISLFDAAGRRVAMGTPRKPYVKDAAAAVIGDVARDGLAEAIDRFVISGP